MTRSPDSSLSCWNERQSAGRAGPPIPRHCAPESSPIRDPLCPATIRRAHTRQQRRHTAVAMSSRGRLVFRRACCTHAMDATHVLSKRAVKRRRMTIDQRVRLPKFPFSVASHSNPDCYPFSLLHFRSIYEQVIRYRSCLDWFCLRVLKF